MDDRDFTRLTHRVDGEPMAAFHMTADGVVERQTPAEAQAGLEPARKHAFVEGGETSRRWRFLKTAHVSLGLARHSLKERVARRTAA